MTAEAETGRARPLGPLWLGLPAALLLLALAWPLVRGQVLVADDLGWFHLPARAFYAERLAVGESFLWRSDQFRGFYAHGEGQAGMAHPLHLALYGLLPLEVGFHLELWLCYPLAMLGMYLLLRRRLPGFAAAFGAVCFGFSGFNLLHFPHLNALAIIAQLPWLLICLEDAVRGGARRRARGRLGIALLTGSQLLLGHPQCVWLSGLAEVAWLGWLVARGPGWRAGLRAFLVVGAAKGIGVLVGAVQLLPTWVALQASEQAAMSEAARNAVALHPYDLVQLLAPWFQATRSHARVLYAGLVAPLLAAGLLSGPRRTRGDLVLAAGALCTLVLALGPWGGLAPLLGELPLVGVFRGAARYVVLLHLALAVLAARAVARLEVGEGGGAGPLGLTVLALLLAGLGVGLHAAGVDGLASGGWHALGAATAALACALLFAARRRRGALVLLGLLALADLGGYGLSYVFRAPPRTVEDFTAPALLPPADGGRLLFAAPAANLAGRSLAGGYAGLMPRRSFRFAGPEDLEPRTLWLAGVRWLRVAPGLNPGLDSLVAQGARWVSFKSFAPRARLVTDVLVSSTPAADLRRIEPRTTALVERPLALPFGRPGRVELLEDRPGSLRLRTVAASRQLLVLDEAWDEGWRATVGGRPSPLLRVYGDYLGCVVEAGEHEVALVFSPDSFHDGLALSGLGLVALLAWTWAALRRARRPRDG